MKNLDESLNTGCLDESFSNIRAGELSESTDSPTTTEPTRPVSYPRSVTPKSLSVATTGVYDLSTTAIVNAVPLVKPVVNSDNSIVATQNQSQFPIMMGGGGSSSEETNKVENSTEEKTIFGVKSTYVYGLGIISALTFVYFKFIK